MWVRWRSHSNVMGFWHMLTEDEEHTMCSHYSAEGVSIECEYDEHPVSDMCGSCVLAAEGLDPVWGARRGNPNVGRQKRAREQFQSTAVVPFLGVH